MIELSIPQVPESYNKIKDWHWAKKDEYNQLWYDEIRVACVNAYVKDNTIIPTTPYSKAKIDFYIYFPFKHRRDKLNYALGLKPALDGIAIQKIIVDDNWERIDDNYYSKIDKNNPRTIIEIRKIKL